MSEDPRDELIEKLEVLLKVKGKENSALLKVGEG
jgi:hypothetical protein